MSDDNIISKRMTGDKFQFEQIHKLHMFSSAESDLRSDNRSAFPNLLKKVKDLQESGQLPKHPTPEQAKDWASAQAALGECESQAHQIVDELTAEAQKLGLGY